jgi:excisionase family DNA binding protein
MGNDPDTSTPHLDVLLDGIRVTEILNISARTLWSLVASGEIPVVRIRRRRLFDPADVRVYIDAAKNTKKGARP